MKEKTKKWLVIAGLAVVCIGLICVRIASRKLAAVCLEIAQTAPVLHHEYTEHLAPLLWVAGHERGQRGL